jgi:hypothetical protein
MGTLASVAKTSAGPVEHGDTRASLSSRAEARPERQRSRPEAPAPLLIAEGGGGPVRQAGGLSGGEPIGLDKLSHIVAAEVDRTAAAQGRAAGDKDDLFIEAHVLQDLMRQDQRTLLRAHRFGGFSLASHGPG